MSQKNNFNIYRGCTHGCIYCDSRSEIYGKTYDFEDIEVKVNGLELLEKELSKRRKKTMITTGAMTDPYIPIEKELQYMRKSLEIIEKYGFGATVLTKSDLVVRDIDIIEKIHKKSKAIVQMTLTTYDEELCKILEPNVVTTKKRYEALKAFQQLSVPTIVWLTPILPFINDTEENIMGILNYCKDAGVKGILTFGIGMTLRYGNREYFYQKLDENFEGKKIEYMKKYGASYGISSPRSAQLGRKIKTFCEKNNMLYGQKAIFDYIYDFPAESSDEQLTLF